MISLPLPKTTDPDGDFLNYAGGINLFYVDVSGVIVFSGSQGSLTLGDTYTFIASVDDQWSSDTANVTINVVGPNNLPPAFTEDSYTFEVSADVDDYTVIGTAPATDAEGDILTYSGGTGPFDIGVDGSILFTGPNGSLTSGDSYTFTANASDQWGSDSATVNINIVQSPILIGAIDDNASGEIGTPIVIGVLANDLGSGLSIDSASSAEGIVTLLDSDNDGYADLIQLLVSDSSLTAAQVQYTAKDAAGNTDTAVAFVALAAPNQAPKFVSEIDLTTEVTTYLHWWQE